MSQTMQQTDSIESHDSSKEEKQKQKSRRPANTAFRQQRLKAWQPILTPKTVLPLFLAVGIIFAPIGGLLIWASSKVEEIAIDYSDCATKATLSDTWPPADDFELDDVPSDKVSSYFKSDATTDPQWARSVITANFTDMSGNVSLPNTTVCRLSFEIPNDIGPPVFFYYRLTNFYQNHRRYVKSMDPDQLKGTARSNSSIENGDCDPLRIDSATGRAYYPCGLIANSLFNDTFNPPVLLNSDNGEQNETYAMTQKGIAWDSDKELYGTTKYTRDQVWPPPNWAERYPEGYTEERDLPDLHDWEPFHVWMRTAGLPAFSKLALRNDNDAMKAGTYIVDIYDYFPVNEYGGTKSILISTRTVMGGKNPFLGIAYVVVGGLCVVLGALFTATHLIKPRKLGDHTYLTWNNEGPSTATATGRSIRPGD